MFFNSQPSSTCIHSCDEPNDLEILSSSRGDQALRRAIAYQVYTHRFFECLVSMPNPPCHMFHIIVNNSSVSMVGIVQSQIEKIRMETIAR